MRRTVVVLALIAATASVCHAGFWGDLLDTVRKPAASGETADDTTVVRGLKEALSIGTDRAVKSLSRPDGFNGNGAVRILLPEKIRGAAEFLGRIGFQRQVDAFVVSMNRAAEQAAPMAATFFVDALKEMTFEDAKGILYGGDTAATAYFEKKTRSRIFDAFRPVVAARMDEVGVARAYKEMAGKAAVVPFVNADDLDLDRYITNKALDGLFTMVGQEEKRIRTDPAARVTELLQTVFGPGAAR